MTTQVIRRLGCALAVALTLVTTAPVTLGGAAAHARAGCAVGRGSYAGATPWAQQSLDATGVAAHTTGAGQTVAVLATGVDARNAQFRAGQVLPGHDVLAAGAPANNDCDGRGTVAAGLIGAQRVSATTFAGLAPDVRIDPIRYVQTTTNSDTNAAADPNLLAQAIDLAVADRVTVILIVVPAAQSTPALQTAVATAVSRGVVVVAPTAAGKGGRSYPAGYPEVLGVGAVDRTGAVVSAEYGNQVSLVAPGSDLVSTGPGTGVQNVWPINSIPAFSGSFVAAAAALLRSRYPAMTAAQVVTRLELTAARAQPSRRSATTGWGTLDVYDALTADLPVTAGLPTADPTDPPRSVRALPAPRVQSASAGAAPWIALGLLAAGLVLGLATFARRRARGSAHD